MKRLSRLEKFYNIYLSGTHTTQLGCYSSHGYREDYQSLILFFFFFLSFSLNLTSVITLPVHSYQSLHHILPTKIDLEMLSKNETAHVFLR